MIPARVTGVRSLLPTLIGPVDGKSGDYLRAAEGKCCAHPASGLDLQESSPSGSFFAQFIK